MANLAARGWVNNSMSSGLFNHEASSHSNSSHGFIQELVFENTKSDRTSGIILAAFNVFVAFAMGSLIIFERYWASKKCNPNFPNSKFSLSSIHPAETFPLILSYGIVIQSVVFAVVQGQGLLGTFESGCAKLSQFVWPG